MSPKCPVFGTKDEFLELEGSSALGTVYKQKGPDFHQDRFCGAEGARTLDLRRDRPAF